MIARGWNVNAGAISTLRASAGMILAGDCR
jgi:hypothetical protein